MNEIILCAYFAKAPLSGAMSVFENVVTIPHTLNEWKEKIRSEVRIPDAEVLIIPSGEWKPPNFNSSSRNELSKNLPVVNQRIKAHMEKIGLPKISKQELLRKGRIVRSSLGRIIFVFPRRFGEDLLEKIRKKIGNKIQNREKLDEESEKFLKKLEKKINQRIPKTRRLSSFRQAVKIENNKIVGLSLYESELKTLPKSITRLDSLEELFLTKNNLKALPESIGNLKSLRRLTLSGNSINTIPESITTLDSLQRLYLRDNPLRTKSLGSTQTEKIVKKLKNKGVSVELGVEIEQDAKQIQETVKKSESKKNKKMKKIMLMILSFGALLLGGFLFGSIMFADIMIIYGFVTNPGNMSKVLVQIIVIFILTGFIIYLIIRSIKKKKKSEESESYIALISFIILSIFFAILLTVLTYMYI